MFLLVSIWTLCGGVCRLWRRVDLEVAFELRLLVVARWMGWGFGDGPGADGLGGRPST